MYVDRTLPFGLRSAPKNFTVVADMIAWAFNRVGIQDQMHYFDDFLSWGPPATDIAAARALSVALQILDHLGFPVAIHIKFQTSPISLKSKGICQVTNPQQC